MSSYKEKDREEGEIVDDEYDEISDNSIIFPLNDWGKSVSPKEQIPLICLSSISEQEEEHEERNTKVVKKLKKVKERLKHHGHHHKSKKKKYLGKSHKRKKWNRLIDCSGSSSNDELIEPHLDKRLKKQLKAAIRVESQDDNNRNSLRTRLRAMTKLNDVEQTSDITKSDNVDKIVDQPVNCEELTEEIDNELIQLRLEALKTAVLNKFEHRKKRKNEELEENQELPNVDNLETNKENTIQENDNIKKSCIDKSIIQPVSPDEEDEDVLRALLLASMSKKMTKYTDKNNENSGDKIKVNPNITKPTLPVKKPVVPFRQHKPPKIKPIIINIGSDTESEDENSPRNVNVKNSNIPAIANKTNSDIESKVEVFLREQRAQVEAQVVPKEATASTTQAFKVSTPKSKIQPKMNESVVLEKSSVKLLPKVKQIEYQKLLQRLKNAQKKPRIRKVSVKVSEENNPVRKNSKTKVNNYVKSSDLSKAIGNTNESFDIKQEARNLHQTLKQMQRQQNGRLQIEEKYVVLTPIVKKINEASTERKKYDQEMKRLLNELAEVQKKLNITHKTFSMYVKELIKKKEEIDKRLVKKNGDSTKPFTSAPKKFELPPGSVKESTVSSLPNIPTTHITTTSSAPSLNSTACTAPTSKPPSPASNPIPESKSLLETGTDNIEPSEPSNPLPNTLILSESQLLLDISMEESECVDEKTEKTDDSQMDIEEQHQGEIFVNGFDQRMNEHIEDSTNYADPNDIVFNIGIPDYVSPLDSVKREGAFDPFLIMCPYDIDGNCRDPECTYKHYYR